MKLKKTFLTHNTGNDTIMVAVGHEKFSGFVRANRTASFIIECLKKETTEQQIVECITAKFDVDTLTAQNDVRNIIEKLKTIGAIDG